MRTLTRMIEYLYDAGNSLQKPLKWLNTHKRELILATALSASGAYAQIGYNNHPAIAREAGLYGNQFTAPFQYDDRSRQISTDTISVPAGQLCLPKDGCERVWGFDNNRWFLYAPNIAADINNLKNMIEGHGYFIYMSRGNKLPDGTQMKDGWNTFSLNPHQIESGALRQTVEALHRTGTEFTIALPDGIPLYNSNMPGVFPNYPDTEIDPAKAYWLYTSKDINITGSQGNTPARIVKGLNLVGGDLLTPIPTKIAADGSKIPLKPYRTVDIRFDGYTLTGPAGTSKVGFEYRRRAGGDNCFLVVEKENDYRDFGDNGCDGRVEIKTIGLKDQRGSLRGVYVSRHGNDGLFIKEIDPEYVSHLEKLGLLEAAARSHSFQEKIGYFLEIAVGAECGGETYIKKWAAGNGPKIRVHGSPTDKDTDALRGIIDELRGLTRLDISLVQEDGKQNVDIYFVPTLEFPKYIPPTPASSKCVVSGTEGLVWAHWDNHIINEAKIVIDTGLRDPTRHSVILEELTQSMGLLNDSNDSERYRESIFFQNASDAINYPPLDEAVIRLLYSTNIRPGMSRKQVLDLPVLDMLNSMRPLSDTNGTRK